MKPLIYTKEGDLQQYVKLSASSYQPDMTPNSAWLNDNSVWKAKSATKEWFMVDMNFT